MNPDELVAAKTKARQEADDEPEAPKLPDLDDDEGWEKFIKEAAKRIEKAGKRSASELLSFARKPIDYDDRLTKLIANQRADMRVLAGLYRDGAVPFDRWVYRHQLATLRAVGDGYTLGIAEAKGIAPSRVRLTAAQRKDLADVLKSQYDYFGKFKTEVQGKNLDELTSKVEARAALYGGASRSAHARGKLSEESSRRLRWVRSKEDSCSTCLAQANKVKTGQEWLAGGILPGQNVACVSNCGCSLQPE